MGAKFLPVHERVALDLQPAGAPAPEPFRLLARCDRARLYSIGPRPAIDCDCVEEWPSLHPDRAGR